MQKKIWLILLLWGCENASIETPKYQRSQLVPILGELRMLESAYALRYQQVDSSVVSIESYQEEIFLRYQISHADLTQSIQYYAARPDSMKALDSLVLIWLEEKYRWMNQSKHP